MMNTSIVTREYCTQLANKELAKELTGISQAIASHEKSAWNIAEGFANIVCNELFVEDFETEKSFADEIGVSKGYLSQCKNAVLFADRNGIDKSKMTIGKCYKLSTLSDEEYKEFCEWCEDNNLVIESMSDKGLVEMLKTWKNGQTEELEELEELEEVEEVEEVEEQEEVEDDEIDVAYIEYLGRKYIIPVAVLEQYEIQ